MPKFRKKPVAVDAIQWDGTQKTGYAIQALCPSIELQMDFETKELIIPTTEGEMKAKVGDWIIQGVVGELYPCHPDVFAKTYDKINERQPTLDLDGDTHIDVWHKDGSNREYGVSVYINGELARTEGEWEHVSVVLPSRQFTKKFSRYL